MELDKRLHGLVLPNDLAPERILKNRATRNSAF